MTEEPSGGKRTDVRTDGPGSIAIGSLVMKLALGDRARSAWNWVPCVLVLALTVWAFVLVPDGPASETAIVALLCLLPLAFAFWRATWGVRLDVRALAAVSWLSVLCALTGVYWADHIVDHGSLDVTHRRVLIPKGEATPGDVLKLTFDTPADRDRVSITLDAASAARGVGVCGLETTFTIRPSAGGDADRHTGIEPGTAVDLPYDDGHGPILVTVDSGQGCRLDITVTKAVLHG